VAVALAVSAGLVTGQHPLRQSLTIEYPTHGSVFPPEITAPTFRWQDAAERAARWRIEVRFADGAATIRALSRGDPPPPGEIDPRCEAAAGSRGTCLAAGCRGLGGDDAACQGASGDGDD
jgi:hypothetical protein